MIGICLIFILVMVLLVINLRRQHRRDSSVDMGSGMLGRSRVKVECVNCHQVFPAVSDRLDLLSDRPQNYVNCPYCHRGTKVTIVR